MNIPKTTKFTLKRIVEGVKDGSIPDNGFGKEVEKLSVEQKRKLQEMASMWENFGQCLQNEESLMNSARGITELCELAETYALNECPDAFQRKIVERDMKEIKKRVSEFQKITKEAYARMQELGVAYQDIGHVLGRYYNLRKNKDLGQNSKAVMQEGDSVCAWCKKTLKKNSIPGDKDTHGICPDCANKFKADVDKEFPIAPKSPRPTNTF